VRADRVLFPAVHLDEGLGPGFHEQRRERFGGNLRPDAELGGALVELAVDGGDVLDLFERQVALMACRCS
jgi:hypothetical protein